MDSIDRRALLLNSTSLNGIDFIEVATDAQTTLRIHFFNKVALAGVISVAITGG